MANYNSKKIYNKKLLDDGANYNSGPFAIIILDRGSGMDDVKDIFANAYIDDIAIGDDNIVAFAALEVTDKSNISTDSISIVNYVDVSDSAKGSDFLPSIFADVNISDSGIGFDELDGVIEAFFVIDSHSTLHPLGVLVTGDSRYELLPATRDYTEEIPGRHGEFDFGTEFKARTLELKVATNEGYEPLEKAHLQRLFAKYLDPTKGYKTLIFSDDISKTYLVKCAGKIDITNHPTWFEFAIPFKMSEPFIIGSFEKTLNGSGILVNEGTVETGIIVEIAGPITDPSVTVGTDVLKYTGTIADGEILVIDTDKQIARIGNTNVAGNYNGVFPSIPPGDTNITASSNVTVKWRDKWL